MVTFYTDENVDGAIIKGLRRKGIDVLTIQEDGRIGFKPDSRVLDRSTNSGGCSSARIATLRRRQAGA